MLCDAWKGKSVPLRRNHARHSTRAADEAKGERGGVNRSECACAVLVCENSKTSRYGSSITVTNGQRCARIACVTALQRSRKRGRRAQCIQAEGGRTHKEGRVCSEACGAEGCKLRSAWQAIQNAAGNGTNPRYVMRERCAAMLPAAAW